MRYTNREMSKKQGVTLRLIDYRKKNSTIQFQQEKVKVGVGVRELGRSVVESTG